MIIERVSAKNMSRTTDWQEQS